MRTTIVLDDELLAKAQELTNVQEKSSLVIVDVIKEKYDFNTSIT